jgi:acyl carrier protein
VTRGETEVSDHDARLEIATWLRSYIGRVLDLDPLSIDPNDSFARMGLDSVASVALGFDLGEWLGCEVEVETVFDAPSVGELSEALGSKRDIQLAVLRRREAAGDISASLVT